MEGVVGHLGLFAGVEPEQVAALARQARVLEARRGEVLARRGEHLPGMFVVGYGLAKLTMRGRDCERVLRLVSAGQTFGEATTLLGQPARYDALALVDTKVVMIPAVSLVALIDAQPHFGRAFACLLAERKLELLDEVEAATLQRSAQRLAGYLVSLDADAARRVQLPVSKTLVAARLGVKKETLSRLLRQFVRDGVIEVSRRDIEILDGPALERLASAA